MLLSDLTRRLKDRYLLYRYIRPFVARNHQRSINPENTICLFCQPRSGSAWFSEIVASIPHSGIIDEPLWRGAYGRSDQMPRPYDQKLQEIDQLNFYFNQPIPEHELWPEAYNMFESLLQVRQPNRYLYEEMDLYHLSQYQTFVFKFNKANLLFHWLRKNFDMKSLVLLRHPCATIASQINGRFYDQARPIENCITPEFRHSEYFEKYADIWKSIKTHEEYLAFIWSVNTTEVMDHPDRNRSYLIISYEGLLTAFDHEIDRIFKYLERPVPDEIEKMYQKVSPTAQLSSKELIQSGQQLVAWRERLSQSTIDNILRVVNSFGIKYYDKNPVPSFDQIYAESDLPK